jgi:hypothetical protein
MTPEARARALLRELDTTMKSPRGDYYQGDVADPNRTLHIVERHLNAAIADEREACLAIADAHNPHTAIPECCGAVIASEIRARCG